MAKRGDHISRAFVREYLATTCGISLVEMEERQNETAADFEMVDSGRRVLIAELKTLEERRPSAESGWTVEVDADGIEEAHRNHNGPARIARKIAEAHRQISSYARPWAVILLNSDHFMLVGDFFEAFAGECVLGTVGGHRVINVASRRIALGETLRIRYEVDLYIWLDRVRKPAICVWWSTPAGEAIARRYFQAEANPTSS